MPTQSKIGRIDMLTHMNHVNYTRFMLVCMRAKLDNDIVTHARFPCVLSALSCGATL